MTAATKAEPVVDLDAEWTDARCNVTGDDLAALKAAGIPDAGIALCGMLPIETYAGGLFETRDRLGGGGDKALIVPCGIWDGLTWQLDDLIAFRLDKPDRWWRRYGACDVLGDLRGFSMRPKTLHPDPLSWLKDGGRGLVLLDWQADPVDLLAGAGEIVADLSLMTRLRKAVTTAALSRLDGIVCHG